MKLIQKGIEKRLYKLILNLNAIKRLNKEFSVEMFHTRVRESKAFAAEQKIREFKKILLQSKRYVKRGGKRIRPNELIKKSCRKYERNKLNQIRSFSRDC